MTLRDADDLRALRRAFLVGIPLVLSAVAYLIAGWGGVACLWLGVVGLFAWAVSQAIEMSPPWP